MRFRSSLIEQRERLARFLDTHWTPLLMTGLLLIVGALAFEGGFLLGRDRTVPPLVIETPCACATTPTISAETPTGEGVGEGKEADAAKNVQTENPSPLSGETIDRSKCAFVGSKNSNKYHLPTCSYAKRILDKNIVCFASASDAESRGYIPGCVK